MLLRSGVAAGPCRRLARQFATSRAVAADPPRKPSLKDTAARDLVAALASQSPSLPPPDKYAQVFADPLGPSVSSVHATHRPPRADSAPPAAGEFRMYNKATDTSATTRDLFSLPTNPLSLSSAWPVYRLYCKSTRNNTIVTFTNELGHPRSWSSAGECGFRGTRGSTPEAAYAATMKMIAKITAAQAVENFRLSIYLSGFGHGRATLITTLASPEGEAIRPLLDQIIDNTPIKIGGTRAKKARRI